MFNVCTIEEAKRLIKETFPKFHLEEERVSIFEALNRYIAHTIHAKMPVPHFNRSTVDGYAIRSKDSIGAGESIPAFLNIIGKVEMGHACEISIQAGQAIYVPTGGALPQGADCVVMIEDTDQLNDDDLFIYKQIAPKENILFKAEDIREGAEVLEKGKQIRPQDLGVLTAIGLDTVSVYRKLKVSVISSGDEIVKPDVTPKIGEIRDINSYTIASEIKRHNADLVNLTVVRDDEQELRATLNKAIETSDIIIISGGSSVGNKDLTFQLLEEIEPASVFIHGIAIKPGKPTIFAKIKGKLVIGLPGQPASALIVLKTFIDHIEEVLIGKKEEPRFYVEANLTKNVHSTPGREMRQMVKLINSNEGYLAEPIYGKSGTITLISQANGYITIPVNSEGLLANQLVKVYKL